MPNKNNEFNLDQLELGKPTAYRSSYAPDLLQAVPRELARQSLGIVQEQPFYGVDIWNAYELSWLNAKGKPVVALMRCSVPYFSPNLIESKSFKLYLNSFNQSRFDSHHAVLACLKHDLSNTAGSAVDVELFAPDEQANFAITSLPGICLDDQDIDVDVYELESEMLNSAVLGANIVVTETMHSHLLKSNCLITNQPDWASLIIEYTGSQIDHEALLRYLISFRMHNEFHEQCVERIYMDITNAYQPQCLSVQALYTRRGGLDINPFRSSDRAALAPKWRSNRQ